MAESLVAEGLFKSFPVFRLKEVLIHNFIISQGMKKGPRWCGPRVVGRAVLCDRSTFGF